MQMIPGARFNYDAAVWKAAAVLPAQQQQQLSASFYGSRVPPSAACRPCLSASVKPEAAAAAAMTSEVVRRALYAAALQDLMTSSAAGSRLQAHNQPGARLHQSLPHQRLRQQQQQQQQQQQLMHGDNRRYLLHHSVTSLITPHNVPLADLHDGMYV